MPISILANCKYRKYNCIFCMLAIFLFKMVLATVDTTGCPNIPPQIDSPSQPYLPRFVFLGGTDAKGFYISRSDYVSNLADYPTAAYGSCEEYNPDWQIATILNACEYNAIFKWFETNGPTNYSARIGAERFGSHIPPMWVSKINPGMPVDLFQFDSTNALNLQGPYSPGAYSEEAYPWANGITVTASCSQYEPPCPENSSNFHFAYEDDRKPLRFICEMLYGSS